MAAPPLPRKGIFMICVKTCKLDCETHRELKTAAAHYGLSFYDLTGHILDDWIRRMKLGEATAATVIDQCRESQQDDRQ